MSCGLTKAAGRREARGGLVRGQSATALRTLSSTHYVQSVECGNAECGVRSAECSREGQRRCYGGGK